RDRHTSLSDFYGPMLSVDDQFGAIVPNRSAGGGMIFAALNLHFIEVAGNLASMGSRLDFQRSVGGQGYLYVALVINLDVPRLVQSDFDVATVLQAQISRKTIQRDVFGSCGQSHRSRQ